MTFDHDEIENILRKMHLIALIAADAALAADQCEPGVDHAAHEFIRIFALGEIERHSAVIERHMSGSTLQ